MLTVMEYVKQSIELNLFFLRIMKEHFLHVLTSMRKMEPVLARYLITTKDKFEGLLTETIMLANGVVGPQSLAAGDIITQYTYPAESLTQYYIGRPLNTDITRMEAALAYSVPNGISPLTVQSVNNLNQKIISLLEDSIQAQKNILADVLSCKMFLMTYAMLLHHIAHESEFYQTQLQMLQNRQDLTDEPGKAVMNEVFWNRKMAEHARIGYGLLDPTEESLMQRAKELAVEFDELTGAAGEALKHPETLPEITRRSMAAATSIRNWKEEITLGLLECKIRSRMTPIIAEHVMREANHYLKELRVIYLMGNLSDKQSIKRSI